MEVWPGPGCGVWDGAAFQAAGEVARALGVGLGAEAAVLCELRALPGSITRCAVRAGLGSAGWVRRI